MHYRPHEKKGCHSREGGNPKPIGGKRNVQLIMFTYLEKLADLPVAVKSLRFLAHIFNIFLTYF